MKKIMLFFIFVICINFVNAKVNDSSLSYVVTWEDGLDDIKNSLTGTAYNTAVIVTDGCKVGDSCLSLDGDSDYVTYPDSDYIDCDGAVACSWGCWVYPDDTQDDNTVIMAHGDTWASDMDYTLMMYRGGTTEYWYNPQLVRDSDNSYHDWDYPLDLDAWNLVIITFTNGKNESYYLNGEFKESHVMSQFGEDANTGLQIGYSAAIGTWYWDGKIDDCFITKKALNSTEIWDYYYYTNQSCNPITENCEEEPPGVPPSLEMFWNMTPQTYNARTISFSFNGTTINNSDIYNCSVVIGDYNFPQLDNVNLSTNIFYNFSAIGLDGERELSVACGNWKDGNFVDNYVNTTIFIDYTEPTINITHFREPNVYYSDTDYRLNMTILDDNNLAGWRIEEYFNNSGTPELVYNISHYNITNWTETILNLTNSSDWCTSPPCSMIQNVTAWDDHNPLHNKDGNEKAKEIIKFKEHGKEKVKFFFSKGDITIQSEDVQEYIVYDEDNKYKLEFDFKKNKDVVLELVGAGWERRITEHKAHFYNRDLEKYFDLDSDDITITNIIQIGNTVYITLDTKKSKAKTNSIGDLNVNRVSTYFTIIERPTLDEEQLEALLSINSTMTNLLNVNTNIQEGIDMLWIIILSLGSLFGLYKFSEALKGEDNVFLNIIKNGVYLTCLIFIIGVMGMGLNQMKNIGMADNVVNVFVAVFIGFMFIIIPIFVFLLVLFIRSVLEFLRSINTNKAQFNRWS